MAKLKLLERNYPQSTNTDNMQSLVDAIDSFGYSTYLGPLSGVRTEKQAKDAGHENSLHKTANAMDLRDEDIKWEEGTARSDLYNDVLKYNAKKRGLGIGADFTSKNGKLRLNPGPTGWDPHHIQTRPTAIDFVKIARFRDEMIAKGKDTKRVDEFLRKNLIDVGIEPGSFEDRWNTNPDIVKWRKSLVEKYGNDADPYRKGDYDYRSAVMSGVTPKPHEGDVPHWDSKYKSDDHPNRFIKQKDGTVLDSKYGKIVPRGTAHEVLGTVIDGHEKESAAATAAVSIENAEDRHRATPAADQQGYDKSRLEVIKRAEALMKRQAEIDDKLNRVLPEK